MEARPMSVRQWTDLAHLDSTVSLAVALFRAAGKSNDEIAAILREIADDVERRARENGTWDG